MVTGLVTKNEELEYLFKCSAWHLLAAAVVCVAAVAQARIGLYETNFNLDWKFSKAIRRKRSRHGLRHSKWETVSVPHSASYDAPTVAGELAAYGNVKAPNVNYWYRKSFTCPVNARKVFIYFGAIMQSATVYVNGSQMGQHISSGYTGFFFDISNSVIRGSKNILAVKANINNDQNIPPGCFNADGSGNGPDFNLYSGMYRDVTILFKDSCYIPITGQRINVIGSAASPVVHAYTSVCNDAKSAKNVMVALTLYDSKGSSAATKTTTMSVPAGGASNFDLTTNAVSNPALWSPSSPTLYTLHTLVSADGRVVDSTVENVGLRFFFVERGHSRRFFHQRPTHRAQRRVHGAIHGMGGKCGAGFPFCQTGCRDKRHGQTASGARIIPGPRRSTGRAIRWG